MSVDKKNEDMVLYYIVREILEMSPGKIAAQCSHATGFIYEKYYEILQDPARQEKIDNFNLWKNDCCRKIVLRASDKEWNRIKTELEPFIVRDAGYTEVKAGEETVAALWPMEKSMVPKIIKRLRLL